MLCRHDGQERQPAGRQQARHPGNGRYQHTRGLGVQMMHGRVYAFPRGP